MTFQGCRVDQNDINESNNKFPQHVIYEALEDLEVQGSQNGVKPYLNVARGGAKAVFHLSVCLCKLGCRYYRDQAW